MRADPTPPPSDETSSPALRGSARSGFGLGFWAAIIFFAVIVGFAQWRVSTWFSSELSAASEEALSSRQVAEEEPHTVPLPPEVRIKRGLIKLSFQKGEERFAQVHKELKAEIQAEFSQIKAQSDGLVKSWADWYYSVTGEYTRLIKLLLAAAGEKTIEGAKAAASSYMAAQVKRQLIDPLNANERVEALEQRLSSRLQSLNSEVVTELKRQLMALQTEAEQRGRVHSEDLKLLQSRARDLEALDELNIISPVALATKALSAGGVKLLISGGLKTGVKVASTAGAKAGAKAGASAGAKAGLKVGQAVAVKVAGKGVIKSALALWAKMLVKFGIKATAKGGGAAAAAASGTVACSFLGPWAFACGAAAGTAAWFAVDKVVVEVDELLNREEFEAELKRDLRGSWEEVEGELIVALDAHFLKIQALVKSEKRARPLKKTTLIEALQNEAPHAPLPAPPTAKPDGAK